MKEIDVIKSKEILGGFADLLLLGSLTAFGAALLVASSTPQARKKGS